MKAVERYVLIAIMALVPSVASGQGFLRPVTPQHVSDNLRADAKGIWEARFDVAMTAVSVYPFKGFDVKPLSKVGAGVFFTHFTPEAVRTFSVGALVTIPTIEGERYGFAAVGAFSIWKVGINYDVGLPFKEGISLMTGVTIDVFNNIR